MKAGDLVVITRGQEPFFVKGDKAILKEQDIEGDWWGDFSNLGNTYVCDDGYWCITEEGDCELVEPDSVQGVTG